jgi:hypothetical protein
MNDVRKAALELQISVTEKAIQRFAPDKDGDRVWAGFTVDAEARSRLAAMLTQLRSELRRYVPDAAHQAR